MPHSGHVAAVKSAMVVWNVFSALQWPDFICDKADNMFWEGVFIGLLSGDISWRMDFLVDFGSRSGPFGGVGILIGGWVWEVDFGSPSRPFGGVGIFIEGWVWVIDFGSPSGPFGGVGIFLGGWI